MFVLSYLLTYIGDQSILITDIFKYLFGVLFVSYGIYKTIQRNKRIRTLSLKREKLYPNYESPQNKRLTTQGGYVL